MKTFLIEDDFKPRSVGDRYMLEQIRLMKRIDDKLEKLMPKEEIVAETKEVKAAPRRKKKEEVV